MASSLPFEYAQRWETLQELLTQALATNNPSERQDLLTRFSSLQEDRDRDLENHLAHLSGGNTPFTYVLRPYQSFYKYEAVTPGTVTDFFDVGFDDSSWATGQGAFGEGVEAPNTDWPSGTDMLIRSPFTIPTGAQILTLEADTDDSGVFYINGNHVYTSPVGISHIDLGPSNFVIGDNLIAARGIDVGGNRIIDLKLSVTVLV